MYDLKRDRIDAVDQSLRMMCSLYTKTDEDYHRVYSLMSKAMAEEPDDDFNIGFPVEEGSPVQFAIYHCDYDCDNHACWSWQQGPVVIP